MKMTLALAALIALPAAAGAETAFQQAQQCASGAGCWGGRDTAPAPVVQGNGSAPQSSGLDPAGTFRPGEGDAVGNLVGAPVDRPKKGLLKGKGKMLMGLLLGAGGGYLGRLHSAAWGLGAPWHGMLLGAVVGVMLGMFLLPKLFGLFHRHKK